MLRWEMVSRQIAAWRIGKGLLVCVSLANISLLCSLPVVVINSSYAESCPLSPTVDRGVSMWARFVILQTKLKDWNWCQGGAKFNNRTKQNTAILCGHVDSEVKNCILTNYTELSGILPWIFYILQPWYCAAWREINSSPNYSVKMNACCWWIPWLLYS